jgi:lysophospholipase L1-like esterase
MISPTTRPELDVALLATDGATTASLLDVQLPRLESSGVVPRVVTLTVGGNDVLGLRRHARGARDRRRRAEPRGSRA